jgi:hypothetical protein
MSRRAGFSWPSRSPWNSPDARYPGGCHSIHCPIAHPLVCCYRIIPLRDYCNIDKKCTIMNPCVEVTLLQTTSIRSTNHARPITTLPVAGRARIRALFFSVESAIRPPVDNLREQLHGFFPTGCHYERSPISTLDRISILRPVNETSIFHGGVT